MSFKSDKSTIARWFGFGKKSRPESEENENMPDSQELVGDGLSIEKTDDSRGSELQTGSHVDTNEKQVVIPPEDVQSDQKSEGGEQPSSNEDVTQNSDHFWVKWRMGLHKTREALDSAFSGIFSGKNNLTDDLLEELETALLVADVGIDTTQNLVDEFKKAVKQKGQDTDLLAAFRELLFSKFKNAESELAINSSGPSVVLVVGVNGVGKTTSIGKLTHRSMAQGLKVMLAAGDTFRAAAVEQLQVWGERNGVPVVAQGTGADSASVIYDAIESARARHYDLIIADTAGRLHNKSNLMEELTKVVRVARKLDESAPHEVLLVLDAGTGQNALSQAREFNKAIPLTGLILTKMDGTAKGGVAFSLVDQLNIPIRYIGLGEGVEDLIPFDPQMFVNELF